MAIERTLRLCKPEAVSRGLTSEIVARIERRGYVIVAQSRGVGVGTSGFFDLSNCGKGRTRKVASAHHMARPAPHFRSPLAARDSSLNSATALAADWRTMSL